MIDLPEFTRQLQNKYTLGEQIGSGSYGQVYEAIKLSNNENDQAENKVAIKFTSLKGQLSREEIQLMRDEGILLESLREVPNPNIIKLIEFFEIQNTILIVTEYCQINLQQLLKPYLVSKTLSRDSADKLFWQMVNSVSHLHIHQKYIHRDIKFSNFLLKCKDEATWKIYQESKKSPIDLDNLINNSSIKLIDFGLSASLKDGSRHTYCGTLQTMAPEVLMNKGYDYGADVFSLGILYHLMVYFRPYSATVPPKENELLMKMLIEDRKKRITIQELYEKRERLRNPPEFKIKRKTNITIQDSQYGMDEELTFKNQRLFPPQVKKEYPYNQGTSAI